ncbi:hypothetical protein J7K86_00825 [bacterium]|nr:hypothetical protein [bacterium]
MYLYLYDSILVEPKYKKILDLIENRLTDLGINGKIVRLTILENASQIVKENLKNEDINTIVAIGRDKLLFETATAMANSDKVLGFIPIEPSEQSEILGIPPNEFACDVLSARLIKKIDLGKINNLFFFSSVEINDGNVKINCDNSYQIIPQIPVKIKIINLDFLKFSQEIKNANVGLPNDSYLEILLGKTKKLFPFFRKIKEKNSIFYAKKIEIFSQEKEETEIIVDQERIIKTPAEAKVFPQALKIIVGKNRLFD